MSRHSQRRERLEPSVIGTVALAVVLLVVSGVFLAWGHVVDPTDDAAADPGGPELVDAAGTTSAAPADDAAAKQEQARQVAPQRIVLRDEVIKPVVEKKTKKKSKRSHEVSLPTSFRVSTFNVLGASHTASGGRHARFGPGVDRIRNVVQLLQGTGVSVAGLQEFQPPQYNVFRQTAPGWGVYPGAELGQAAMANSIVWRTDVWELVSAQTIPIPYFGGNPMPMPYVQLRNLQSGRTVWFFNTHNPADAHGPAQQYRNRATALEIDLAQRLSADGSPVVFTGDMNDREPYFCPMTMQTEMHAANGGSTGTPCAMPPGPTNVDWIMGNGTVSFENFHSDYGPLVQRTSDHHFVWADATIPADGSAQR
jgi:endonuclease/exonuclease/phosphatase family metal-dependent hydrolase